MTFLDGINWETVLIASIAPLLLFAGIIYNDVRKKKNSTIDITAAITTKREPTWVELEESNRKLRAEMEGNKKESDERYQSLEARFDHFEKSTNKRIGALSNMLHASAEQWPDTHTGPYFDQADLEALENTDVPFVWRNRIRPAL